MHQKLASVRPRVMYVSVTTGLGQNKLSLHFMLVHTLPPARLPTTMHTHQPPQLYSQSQRYAVLPGLAQAERTLQCTGLFLNAFISTSHLIPWSGLCCTGLGRIKLSFSMDQEHVFGASLVSASWWAGLGCFRKQRLSYWSFCICILSVALGRIMTQACSKSSLVINVTQCTHLN